MINNLLDILFVSSLFLFCLFLYGDSQSVKKLSFYENPELKEAILKDCEENEDHREIHKRNVEKILKRTKEKKAAKILDSWFPNRDSVELQNKLYYYQDFLREIYRISDKTLSLKMLLEIEQKKNEALQKELEEVRKGADDKKTGE